MLFSPISVRSALTPSTPEDTPPAMEYNLNPDDLETPIEPRRLFPASLRRSRTVRLADRPDSPLLGTARNPIVVDTPQTALTEESTCDGDDEKDEWIDLKYSDCQEEFIDDLVGLGKSLDIVATTIQETRRFVEAEFSSPLAKPYFICRGLRAVVHDLEVMTAKLKELEEVAIGTFDFLKLAEDYSNCDTVECTPKFNVY